MADTLCARIVSDPSRRGQQRQGFDGRREGQPDRDAGSRTMFSYLRMFVDAGLHVAFWPENLYRDRTYIRALQDIGVEVLYGRQLVGNFGEWLKQRAPYLDYILLSRAHVAEKLIAD